MLTTIIIVIVVICAIGGSYQSQFGAQNQTRKLREELRKEREKR